MDLATFESLYRAHAQRLYAFFAYRTGDHDAAEDLLASVFERAMRRRGLFDRRRGTEEAWLYAIALNLVRDRARRIASERAAVDRAQHEQPSSPPSLDAVYGERDAIRRAVAELSQEERDTVSLRFGADLTVPQIAALLDVPITTVEGRLYRSLRKLRALLGDAAPADLPRSPGDSPPTE